MHNTVNRKDLRSILQALVLSKLNLMPKKIKTNLPER